METGLRERVAIVTGAASGIGRACTRALAAEGARVVAADVDGAGAAVLADELGGIAVETDVTSRDDVRRLVVRTVNEYGALDVLVTCAGIFQATPVDLIEPEEWDRVLAVNLRGTFLACQAALEVMIPRGSGRIVTIASLGAQTGGLAAGAAYAASKGGVASLTKSLARFAGPHGIVVNTVNPGVVDTPMTAAWPPETRERTIGATPLGRMASADEVAAAVVWLSSDAAGFVHGTHLDVNGGLLMD